MSTTTIRISTQTHNTLRELARIIDLPMQKITEQAIEQYKRQYFLAATNAAYAQLRADEPAWQNYLVLEPQPEGGYVVTCPVLSELITEGDTLDEAVANANDALTAIIEAYEDLKRPLPSVLQPTQESSPLWLETALAAS
jgi:antitoxin HicB